MTIPSKPECSVGDLYTRCETRSFVFTLIGGAAGGVAGIVIGAIRTDGEAESMDASGG